MNGTAVVLSILASAATVIGALLAAIRVALRVARWVRRATETLEQHTTLLVNHEGRITRLERGPRRAHHA